MAVNEMVWTNHSHRQITCFKIIFTCLLCLAFDRTIILVRIKAIHMPYCVL
jgi:hypothetical protein